MGATEKRPRFLVCSCERTMELDGEKLKSELALDQAPTIHTQLCRSQIDLYEKALQDGEDLIVACTQEAPLFREIRDETDGAIDENRLRFVNIRERAGWCENPKDAQAKISALLADAVYAPKPARTTALTSDGVCLVYGAGQQALDIATELAPRLSVSLLLTDADGVIPPDRAHIPIHRGSIKRASGSLGGFEIHVDDYAPMTPSSRDETSFVMARNNVTSQCDIILDLSGGAPFFPAHGRRDGYFHVDPGNAVALHKALFALTDLVGEFEKPLYVTYDSGICAHGRSGKVGCSNCLDNCPVSAIIPDGDHVLIDNHVCGGCGNCAASCPTGAVSYDLPNRTDLIERCQILLSTYQSAGGKNPVLLFHDERHGGGLISAMARFGRGLPPRVLPLSVYAATSLGHDILLGGIASGAETVVILVSPERKDELSALELQVALSNHFLKEMGYEGEQIQLVCEQDPDIVETLLHELSAVDSPHVTVPVLAQGGKRDIARLVLGALNESAPSPQQLIQLPEGSPYGRIQINTDNCTLCLACVGSCPAGALSDNPERPEVRFTEAACVQCGICRSTCPEKVITLEPRFDFRQEAMSPALLNGEEPFHCVSCGKPFGTKSSIERVKQELTGKHWMFQSTEQARLIEMCDDCRVVSMASGGDDPFALGEVPRVRTTEDYIAEQSDPDKKDKTPDDFLS